MENDDAFEYYLTFEDLERLINLQMVYKNKMDEHVRMKLT